MGQAMQRMFVPEEDLKEIVARGREQRKSDLRKEKQESKKANRKYFPRYVRGIWSKDGVSLTSEETDSKGGEKCGRLESKKISSNNIIPDYVMKRKSKSVPAVCTAQRKQPCSISKHMKNVPPMDVCSRDVPGEASSFTPNVPGVAQLKKI